MADKFMLLAITQRLLRSRRRVGNKRIAFSVFWQVPSCFGASKYFCLLFWLGRQKAKQRREVNSETEQ